MSSQELSPTQGIKRYWVAEGHGSNDRRWLCFAYESGRQWFECRVYGPPSVETLTVRWSVDTKPYAFGHPDIKERLALLLPLALQWIANPLPTTIQIIKERYEDAE